MNGSIYALKDPITDKIRYVGQTRGSIENRLKLHWRDRNQEKNKNNHKANWIRKLYNDHNLKPIVILLEFLNETNDDIINKREKYWIEYYRKLGFDLTNTSDNDYLTINRYNSKKNCKNIFCYKKDGTEYFFESAREAEKMIGISYKKISSNAKGKYLNMDFTFSFFKLNKEEVLNKFKGKNIVNTKIKSIDKITGKEKIFDNQIKASEYFKCNFRNINLVLKGIRKHCANQKWEYVK